MSESMIEELAREERPPKGLRHNWRSALWSGVAIALLGILAMALPFATAVTASFLLGATLHWGNAFTRFLGGALTLILGVVLVLQPVRGSVGLLFLLALFLIVEGAFRSGLALQMRPIRGWGYGLGTGLLGVAAGIVLLLVDPVPSVGLFGFLVGAYLLGSGLSLVAVGLAARKASSSKGAAPTTTADTRSDPASGARSRADERVASRPSS